MPDVKRVYCLYCLTGFMWLLMAMPGSVQAEVQGAAAQPAVELDYREHLDISDRVQWFHDPRAAFDLEAARANVALLRPVEKGVLNKGYIDGALWLRLFLHNPGPDPIARWLEVANPILDEVRLYELRGSRPPSERISDYRTPFSEREMDAPAHVFNVELAPGETREMWIRVINTNGTNVPVMLWTTEAWAEHMLRKQLGLGLFYGGMLIMLLYNLFIYWTVRERSYIYYCLYLAGMIVFMLTEQVQGLAIFNQVPALTDKRYLPYQMWVEWLFIIEFARTFLNTREREQDIDVVLRLFRNTALVSLALAFVMPLTRSVQWATYLTLLGGILMIGCGWVAQRRGNPSAGYYSLAWTANFMGASLFAATTLGLIPYGPLTPFYPPVGVLAQIVLIAFALANHIKTVQRRALRDREMALQHLRRYREVFDNAVEGIFQIGLDGRFLEANPAMARMLGYPSPSLMKRHCSDALSACFADPEQRQRIVDALQAQGAIQGEEVQFLRSDGQPGYANVSAHVVFDQRGRPSHIEGMFVDITERKEREQLEKEREQARLQQQVAQASAEAKSRFLAHMSYEIRTPLTAIIGYGETLLDADVTEEERQMAARTVVRSGNHLLNLINDILDHSKIEANRLTVEIIPVNLFALLDDVRSVFEERAREKEIGFRVEYRFPLPEVVETDPVRLRQILINLCSNAVKFTEEGEVVLSVGCDATTGRLQFEIRDTGIGMTPEQLARVFQPFTQADDSVARRFGGTGLGLVISKRLAMLLGGDIQVSSEFGRGSIFRVTVQAGNLNRGKWVRSMEEMPRLEDAQVDLSAPRLSGRVLVAEDNRDNQQLLRMLLSKTGVGITVVDTGRKAVDAALATPYDLILMDIQMPEMDGREAVVRLRQAGYEGMIVALTANVLPADIDAYKQAGFDDWLAKPIDRTRLYELMERCLSHEQVRQEVPQLEGTVLLAEDNAVNRKLIRRYLEKAGLSVLVAEDGRKAVELMSQHRGDIGLVLTDMEMPHMDGLEATQTMREMGYTGPIYALTGNTSLVDVKRCFAAGCDGHLAKPVDRQQLYTLLNNCLGGTRTGRPEPTENNG